jgi:hypothetical protein
MKGKYILGALLGVILIAALVYFYGGSQAPPGQPPSKVSQRKMLPT